MQSNSKPLTLSPPSQSLKVYSNSPCTVMLGVTSLRVAKLSPPSNFSIINTNHTSLLSDATTPLILIGSQLTMRFQLFGPLHFHPSSTDKAFSQWGGRSSSGRAVIGAERALFGRGVGEVRTPLLLLTPSLPTSSCESLGWWTEPTEHSLEKSEAGVGACAQQWRVEAVCDS